MERTPGVLASCGGIGMGAYIHPLRRVLHGPEIRVGAYKLSLECGHKVIRSGYIGERVRCTDCEPVYNNKSKQPRKRKA